MTLLLSSQSLSKSYGSRHLFKNISMGIFKGDKVGLIGPNGSGKSTFLKILAGIEFSDEGMIVGNRSLSVGYVPQESIFPDKSIEEIVVESLEESKIIGVDPHLQAAIALSKVGFSDLSIKASKLSGGWRKRLAIAKEAAKNPDVLLLDEPTNHLDLEGVIWLEQFLKNAPFAYVVITHDRCFLENVTTKTMELNAAYPKGLFMADGPYSYFLEKKEEFLSGQKQQEQSLGSKVRREVEWLKQNPKARTTKSQSRIQEAEQLIKELGEIKGRNKESKSQIDFSSTQRGTKKLLVATNVAKSIGERQLFSHLHLTLSPGLRLGIVGSNGSGKTTLLRLLAGEMTPDQGTIKYAENLKIIYFDQHRVQLPPDLPLRRALCPEGDTITYRGRSIHVNGWARRFLFDPNRLDLPFGHLSGGEKARAFIARLMLQPADILLLDEPTNDLDIPTLELLEESLLEFPGAVVLISHDRYMLDQICNVFLGLGIPGEPPLFADYRQWEQYQTQQTQVLLEKSKPSVVEKTMQAAESKAKKLSYLEKKELDQMESKILEIEQEIERLHVDIQDPAILAHPAKLDERCRILQTKQHQRDKLYERWEELEIKRSI